MPVPLSTLLRDGLFLVRRPGHPTTVVALLAFWTSGIKFNGTQPH